MEENLEFLGVRDDLRLDPGGGEEQVHDDSDPVGFRADQARRCEPADRGLL